MQQVFNQLQARKDNTTKSPITIRHLVTALFKGFILLHLKNMASLHKCKKIIIKPQQRLRIQHEFS